MLEYNPSSIREIIKKIKTKIPEFSLIKDQQEMWELENKFYQERFVDNRKEHEKWEIVTKSRENLKKPSSQPYLSFIQRENLRRQQRQRSGSAPARLG